MPLPKPSKKESESDFVSRFISDEVMVKDYPDQKQRAAVAYSTFREMKNSNGWPQKYSCKFIEPGLVHYDEYGTVLVKKDALDAMAKSFIGKPVINETHKDVSPYTFEEDADGIVIGVHYNSEDGWYWADFLVWDEPTKRNCSSTAYSVSCAYDVKDFKEVKGEHNNIPYEKEVLGGEYTHLAIVANPRYEDARIVVYNSKEGSKMNLKFWKKGKKDVKNSIADGDLAKAMVNVDGEDVPMENLISTYKASLAAADKQEPITEDTMVEIDGNEVPMKNIMDAHRAAKNAAKDEPAKDDEKTKENAEDKPKEDEEKKKENAGDEDKDKKDEKEKENALANSLVKCAECEKDIKKENVVLNGKESICGACASNRLKVMEDNGNQFFDKLKNADSLRGKPQQPVKFTSSIDKVQEGRNKYGTVK